MLVAILLGLLQGVTEWLPVSSEGVVTAGNSFFFDRTLSEAVAYALWLHLGTVFSVLVAFRKEVVELLKNAAKEPGNPSNLLKYLVITTLVSGAIGLPLLLALEELSIHVGAAAMGVVGVLMFITGGLQLLRKGSGTRGREEISPVDAIVVGVAQGFAVLPGLSRSGLTVAVLLLRRVDRREALVLSFLMSVPASLGAGLYASIDSGLLTSGSALLAAVIAGVVGFVTIRILMAVAEKVDFGLFVIIVGATIVAGAAWQAFS